MSSDEGTQERQRPGEHASGVAAAEAVSSTENRGGAYGRQISTKPKRPLSSYNYFFHHERERILAQTPTRKEGKPRRSHGKIGFADLARRIAAKWKTISKEDRAVFNQKAAEDKIRYQREMEIWRRYQQQAQSSGDEAAVGGKSTVAPSAARMPVRPPSQEPTRSYEDPLDSRSWPSAMDRRQPQLPVDDTVGSMPLHDLQAPFEQFFAEPEEDERKMAAEPYSLNEPIPANQRQEETAAAAMPQQHIQQQHASGQYAAFRHQHQQQGQQLPPPDRPIPPPPEARQGLEHLAGQLDDESTDLFLSMFRRSE